MMTFEHALTAIKDGMRVTRTSWRDSFVFLVPGSSFQVNRAPLLGIYPEGTTVQYHSHIDQRMPDGVVMPWTPTQSDLLAKDWVVIRPGQASAHEKKPNAIPQH